MGGRVAIAFAATYPDRIAQLYLESTRPGINNKPERLKRQHHDANLAAQLLSGSLADFVDRWEALPLFASQARLKPVLKTQIRQGRLAQAKHQLAESLIEMGTGAQPSYWANLRDFNFQTTVITGQLDHKFTQIGQDMLQALPQGYSRTIPNVGHNVHLEAPETVRKILKLEG
jgi:2-succinyl-6-hydroxy-2,4-cyclohexadiene-1-carboxylate synthase